MLSQKDYAMFNLKMNKILKDCYIPDPSQDKALFLCNGHSSQTKEASYYYNKNAENHREELIELCKMIPRLKNVALGTAGTIPFSSLISDTKVPGLLKKQMVTADHFINLLVCNGLGVPEKIDLENGGFITHIDLHHSLEKVLRETPGQEPFDD